VDYSLTRSFQGSPEDFDLSRMEALLSYLGNPHQKYRVIHVAGTKGKGSTAAMIASCLQMAGYKVGFYTSPHLEEFNERIQINGKLIPDQRLVDLVEKIKEPTNLIHRLTTFELTTAIAFEYFSAEKVDLAVIEVGLGGRLDATNLVDPMVSVITSISLDHTAVLGNTPAKIANEKAGIIKPGRPVVCGPQRQEALQIIQAAAADRNSRFIHIGEDFRYASMSHDLKSQVLAVWHKDDQENMNAYVNHKTLEDWKPTFLTIPLLGYHQVENAAIAYAVLLVCRENGINISCEALETGFNNVFWPCRFEVLSDQPLLIVDSAHNVDSALKLRLTIEDYLPGMPIVLLFGASEDKDVLGMFRELLPRINAVVVTESIHPRAMSLKHLEELAARFGRPVFVASPIEAALEKALDLAGEECAVIAAGSLFIAAGVRQAWEKLGFELQSFKAK